MSTYYVIILNDYLPRDAGWIIMDGVEGASWNISNYDELMRVDTLSSDNPVTLDANKSVNKAPNEPTESRKYRFEFETIGNNRHEGFIYEVRTS